MKIREDGFNGTAGTIGDADVLMMIAKSRDGARCGDTLRKSGSTVVQEISTVGRDRGKRCFSGLTTRGNFDLGKPGRR